MNIRKALVSQLLEDLEMRFKKAQWELIHNRRQIKQLAEAQSQLKKTCSEIGSLKSELVRSMNPKGDGV